MAGAGREAAASAAGVVLVPGLWMPAASLALLAARLRRAGLRTSTFGYFSTLHPLAVNARRLGAHALAQGFAPCHFVCHSLGGLIVQHLLESAPPPGTGRVVALGTPFAGSAVARALLQRPALGWTLGASGPALAAAHAAHWAAAAELGVLAGARPAGLGRWFAPLPRPHDGTVAVAETQLTGCTAHRVLPVSHTGMLFSAPVARQTLAFLHEGRFAADL